MRQSAACTVALVDGGAHRLAALFDGDDDLLAEIAAFAMRWPPASAMAEPLLLAMLSSAEVGRRRRGARGLEYIGVDLTEATVQHPSIAAALHDPDPKVRDQIAEVLVNTRDE